MKDQNYDLAVAYRVYPKISKNPPIFHGNKFLLARLCLKTFKESLDSLKVKIFAILDNCPPEYEELFKEYFNEKDLEIIKPHGIGNQATFDLQLEALLKQNNSEFVYFAEDDYFFLPIKFKKMLSLLKKDPEVDILTPYDHPDHYYSFLHKYVSNIKSFANHHWRSVNTTTCSFLTTKKILEKNKKIFKIYSKKPYIIELSMWVCLTKYGVFNPFRVTKFAIKKKVFLLYYLNAWRYGWKQILFGRKYKMWCPIPSFATHMERDFLAPSINWVDSFNKEIEKIRKK